jgi:hypothetical protein
LTDAYLCGHGWRDDVFRVDPNICPECAAKAVGGASGAPVVVDAADIMCALLHMGLPCGDYTHDGKHGQKRFLLDEFDRLTEYVED